MTKYLTHCCTFCLILFGAFGLISFSLWCYTGKRFIGRNISVNDDVVQKGHKLKLKLRLVRSTSATRPSEIIKEKVSKADYQRIRGSLLSIRTDMANMKLQEALGLAVSVALRENDFNGLIIALDENNTHGSIQKIESGLFSYIQSYSDSMTNRQRAAHNNDVKQSVFTSPSRYCIKTSASPSRYYVKISRLAQSDTARTTPRVSGVINTRPNTNLVDNAGTSNQQGRVSLSAVRGLNRGRARQTVVYDGNSYGGAANAAFSEKGRVAIVVAGNSGRPGGSLSLDKDWSKLDRNKIRPHDTQEEDIFANFLRSSCTHTSGYFDITQAQHILRSLQRQWGLLKQDAKPGARDFYTTRQGVNYVYTTNYNDFSRPCVGIKGRISRVVPHRTKANYRHFDVASSSKSVDLIFIAGPNAGSGGSPTGSMQRTACIHAKKDYQFFRACVSCAVKTSLDYCKSIGFKHGDTVILPRLSCGVYAGPWKVLINQQFNALVQDILAREQYPFAVKIVGTSNKAIYSSNINRR